MVKRKRTTPMDEEDRINERIKREHNPQTEKEYDQAFLLLFERSETELSSKQQTLRNKSRNDFARDHGLTKDQKETTFKRRGRSVGQFRDRGGRFAKKL